MLRPSPNTRLTAQDKGSAKVRWRRAAEAQIGMRGNLTRLLPPRLQLPRLLRQHLPLRYLLPRHLLPPRLLSRALLAVSLLVPGLVSGCGTVSNISSNLFGSSGPPEGQPGHVQGFLGGVAADEPHAALIARDVLSQGGNAADAAVALGFALSVTLPSRAALGGGGACVAFASGAKSVNAGVPEAVLFIPPAASSGAGADRPAAVPMLARGLYLLHARYGHLPFESLIVPAEQMARFGTPISRALAQDLAVVGGPLLADPTAAAIFGHGSSPLNEGQPLLQPALASTLAQLRTVGVGDFYQGVLARRIVNTSVAAGGPLTLADLHDALPRLATPISLPYRDDKLAFLPPPADGGLAAAAAFQALQHDPSAFAAAQARADAVVARSRAAGGDPMAVLAADLPGANLPPLPASTSFVTIDRDGNAVACALTMNNLFGTGRVLADTGLLLAASPAAVPPPELAAAIAWNEPTHAFRAAVAGSGQEAAGTTVALALYNALRSGQAMAAPVPDPGRVNVATCSQYLPNGEASCRWATDPRGAGLAIGGGGN
jgi:gamma-glutamyltranspeptidase/glutathione hydrolase